MLQEFLKPFAMAIVVTMAVVIGILIPLLLAWGIIGESRYDPKQGPASKQKE